MAGPQGDAELTPRMLAQLAFDDFNRHRGQDFSPSVRDLMDAEVEIVPLRAALEATVYSGPTAVDRFLADTRESWSSIRIEIDQIREVTDDSVVLSATMNATGRDSGANVETKAAWVVTVRAGRITRAATYPSEEAALQSVIPGDRTDG